MVAVVSSELAEVSVGFEVSFFYIATGKGI